MPEYRNLLWLVLPLFNLILSAPVGAESFNADAIKSEIQFSIIARNCSLALHKVQDKFYYIESYEKLNWFEANAACIQAGLQLTTISSEQEFFELESYLSRMGFRGDWIWIGGFGRQGSWLQLGLARPLPYAKWNDGQPDCRDTENCINLYRIGENWFMNDYVCRKKLSYICEERNPLENNFK